MNANTTTLRQRSTQRSPRSTTGNVPALDRSVVPTTVLGLDNELWANIPAVNNLPPRSCLVDLSYLTSMFWQGSESEDEEYHKKKKRSQSKSPSERSSSGESGEWFSEFNESLYHHIEEMQRNWHLLTFSAWNQREAIRNPRSTRRRARRDATSLYVIRRPQNALIVYM